MGDARNSKRKRVSEIRGSAFGRASRIAARAAAGSRVVGQNGRADPREVVDRHVDGVAVADRALQRRLHGQAGGPGLDKLYGDDDTPETGGDPSGDTLRGGADADTLRGGGETRPR